MQQTVAANARGARREEALDNMLTESARIPVAGL